MEVKTWGVSATPKKRYIVRMNNLKNLVIAILTGLLALSLSTQNSNGAVSTSPSAKAIQYDHCLSNYEANDSTAFMNMERNIKECAKYKP